MSDTYRVSISTVVLFHILFLRSQIEEIILCTVSWHIRIHGAQLRILEAHDWP